MTRALSRSLLAVYATVFAWGLAYGLVLPTISIRLDTAGHDSATIGAVVAVSALSVLFMAGKVPSLQARFGMVPITVACLLLQGLVFLTFIQVEHLFWWFVISFVWGLVNTVPWVITEVWINAVVPKGKRGRYMAIYAGLWGVGMALGPQVMLLVGAESNWPFYISALIYAACALAIFVGRAGAPEIEADRDSSTMRATFAMLWLMPILVLYAFAGGLAETVIYALMPIYAIDSGYGEAFGANLITAFAAGGIILQYGVGWLSDRFPPRHVMTFLLATGTLSALALPLAGAALWLAFLLAFVFGGMVMSVYTLAITLVGHGIARKHLSTAHALMVICYTAGG
ncbi:MAG: MFS transporter [Pseudomonadota bacterium]